MKLPALLIPLLMSALTPSSSEAGILETLYGTLPDGRPVKIWTLTNASGLEARITEFGAILVSLRAPDREGNFADLTVTQSSGQQAAYGLVQAGSDAVCIAYTSITWPDGNRRR